MKILRNGSVSTTKDIMKKLLLAGIAAMFLATGTAHAAEWSCGLVHIELQKNMVHDYTLTINGPLPVNPLHANVTELRDGTITFNAKRCKRVERKEEKK
jgi:hypothetical protein